MPIPQKPTGTRRPKQQFRHSELFGSIDGERHNTIRDNTGHRRAKRVRRIIELIDEMAKRSQAVFGGGCTERGDVLGGMSIAGWETIWDGLKSKVREAVKRVGAPRPLQTLMVVFGVDKSDEKASVVKYFG